MASVADLLISVGMNVSDAQKGSTQVIGFLDSMAEKAVVAAKALTLIGVGIGLKKLAEDIVEVTRVAGEQAEQIGHLSQQMGVSESTIQQWSVALNRAHMGPEDLVRGMKQLSNQMEQAQDDTSDAAKTFRELGLDVSKLSRDPEQAIRSIADRVSHMENGFQKARLMTELLGRAGVNLIPLFNGGAKAIDEAAAAADRMGSLNKRQLAELEAMDDSFDDLSQATNRFFQQVGATFAPAMKWIIDLLTEGVIVGTAFWQNMDDAAAKLVVRFSAIAEVLSAIGQEALSGKGLGAVWDQIKAIDAEAAKKIAEIEAGVRHKKDEKEKGGGDLLAKERTAKEIEALKKSADLKRAIEDEIAKAEVERSKTRASEFVALLEGGMARQEISEREGFEALAALRQLALDDELTANARQIQALVDQHAAKMKALQPSERAQEEKQFNLDMMKLVHERASMAKKAEVETTKANQKQLTERHKLDEELKASALAFAVWEESFRRENVQRALNTDADRAEKQLAIARESGVSMESLRLMELDQLALAEKAQLNNTALNEQERLNLKMDFAAKRMAVERTYRQKEIDGELALAGARIEAAQANFATAESIAGLRAQQLELQMQKELEATELTESGRLAIIERYTALIDQQRRRETGGFIEGYKQAMQEYLNSTTNTFNIGTDFARRSVESMSSGIQTILVDAAHWQFHSFQEIASQAWDTILNLGLQVVAQLITQWIMSSIIQSGEMTKQAAAHTAMEGVKTTVTQANEKARTAIVLAETTAVFTAMAATVSAVVGLGMSVVTIIETVGNALGGFLVAVGTAIAAIPGGQAIGFKIAGAGITTLQATNAAALQMSAGISAAASMATAAIASQAAAANAALTANAAATGAGTDTGGGPGIGGSLATAGGSILGAIGLGKLFGGDGGGGGFLDSIKGLFGGGGETSFMDAFNFTGGGGGFDFGGMSSFSGFGGLDLFGFADGGIVHGPTAALIGEAGYDEMITPLNSEGMGFLRKALGTGTGQQQVIVFQVGRRELGRMLVEDMPKHVRLKLGTAL